MSLKLISSFKRVKNLTKDWRQVAEAIERKSVRLEVNDLKTKVLSKMISSNEIVTLINALGLDPKNEEEDIIKMRAWGARQRETLTSGLR